MILTCPECATSYFVDDAQLGNGRTVRCAACGVSWRASPSPTLELTVSPEEGAVAVGPAEAREPSDAALAELPSADVARAFRARAVEKETVREAATQGVVWAGLGAGLAMAAIAAVVFRIDVVQVFPRAASAYAAVGLPVNRVGLTIEDVKAEPSLKDGHAALVVSGVLRNVRGKPVAAPPLSIALLGKDGKRLMTRTAQPGEGLVPAGQARRFSISVLDPPDAASDLEVTFRTDLAAPPARRAAALRLRPEASPAPARQAMALGPPVEDAKPLPDGSPYALAGPDAGRPSP